MTSRRIPIHAGAAVLLLGMAMAPWLGSGRASGREHRATDDHGGGPTTTAGSTTTVAPADGGGAQGPSCAAIPPEGEGSFAGMADDPVAIAAGNNPYLTTVASAVQAAGLADTLNGPGPFTVFAPSNQAFAAIPSADLDAILADNALLTDILTYHVIVGKAWSSAELLAAGSVTTAEGGEIVFSQRPDGLVSLNDGAATITCADIQTANATVHVIDMVLLPPGTQLVPTL